MTQDTAERWVTISALITAGVYAYRRLTEAAQPGGLKNVIGLGNPVPLGQFAVAWGFTYLVVAVMASASPGLGGGFAILIATGDLLTNTSNLVQDVQKGETATAAGSTSPTVPSSKEGKANVPGGTSEAAAAAGVQGVDNAVNNPRYTHG